MQKKNIKTAARILLGAGLIFAGVGHLSFARKEFQAQVPDWVPLKKDDTVVYSGFVEIAMGSALIFTNKKNKKTIGKITAAFFTAVFPGNISQYVHKRNAFGLDSDKKDLSDCCSSRFLFTGRSKVLIRLFVTALRQEFI